MSAVTSVAPVQGRLARAAPAAGIRGRALLFTVILVTSVSAFGLSVVSFAKPIGEGDGMPDFAAIAPNRAYVWAFFLVAGVQLVVGASAAALAAWLLASDRGARWATVGGSLVWLGAAIYGVGIGGWATVYYFATDPTALDPAAATRLVDHVNDAGRTLGVPIGGALLVALGSLLLAVAVWRAATVPRWVPIVGALSTLATLALPPDGVPGLIAEGASSVSTIALGWYAWKRYRGAVAPPGPA
jgi:hypothetical protein